MPFGTFDVLLDPTTSYPHIAASLLASIAIFNIGDSIKLPFLRYDEARYGPWSRLEMYAISITVLAIAAGLECWAFAQGGHAIQLMEYVSLIGVCVPGLLWRPVWQFLQPKKVRTT